MGNVTSTVVLHAFDVPSNLSTCNYTLNLGHEFNTSLDHPYGDETGVGVDVSSTKVKPSQS
jgi:hypothetical protein